MYCASYHEADTTMMTLNSAQHGDDDEDVAKMRWYSPLEFRLLKRDAKREATAVTKL